MCIVTATCAEPLHLEKQLDVADALPSNKEQQKNGEQSQHSIPLKASPAPKQKGAHADAQKLPAKPKTAYMYFCDARRAGLKGALPSHA